MSLSCLLFDVNRDKDKNDPMLSDFLQMNNQSPDFNAFDGNIHSYPSNEYNVSFLFLFMRNPIFDRLF